MNNNIGYLKVILIILLILLFHSCKKPLEIPTVTTTDVTADLTQKNLIALFSGGNILSDGGTDILSRGICWSTLPEPTIADYKTTDGAGTGEFTSIISGTSVGENYYLRAYATNLKGTGYGNAVSFTKSENSVYNTATIGTQIWLAENLKATHFNDGTAIPVINDAYEWSGLTTPGACWHDFDSANYNATYGLLYNWYTVSTGKLCPAGWHVPSQDEFGILFSFTGSNPGYKLREVGSLHWLSIGYNDIGGTNEFGFTAVPGGAFIDFGYSIFISLGTHSFWWTSTQYNSSAAFIYYIQINKGRVFASQDYKKNGYAIRCLKD